QALVAVVALARLDIADDSAVLGRGAARLLDLAAVIDSLCVGAAARSAHQGEGTHRREQRATSDGHHAHGPGLTRPARSGRVSRYPSGLALERARGLECARAFGDCLVRGLRHASSPADGRVAQAARAGGGSFHFGARPVELAGSGRRPAHDQRAPFGSAICAGSRELSARRAGGRRVGHSRHGGWRGRRARALLGRESGGLERGRLVRCEPQSFCFGVAPRSLGEGTVGLDAEGNVVRLRGERFGTEARGGDYVGVLALGAGALASLPERGCLFGDAVLPLLRAGGRVPSVAVTTPWTDAGDLPSLLRANLDWLAARGMEAFLGPGAELAAGVQLRQAVVGAGARVEGQGVLERCVVCPGATAVAPLSNAIVAPSGRVIDTLGEARSASHV